MKRRFKITRAEVGSWSTSFTVTDLDHPNSANAMSPQALLHHIGELVGKRLGELQGLEFEIQIDGEEVATEGFDPLAMCGKTLTVNGKIK